MTKKCQQFVSIKDEPGIKLGLGDFWKKKKQQTENIIARAKLITILLPNG